LQKRQQAGDQAEAAWLRWNEALTAKLISTQVEAGPDAGYALRLLSSAELPDADPDLRAVLAALMTARAAALGRGPVMEDLEVALVLCGYGFEADQDVIERREHWKAAVPHETRPGHTAVAESDPELIVNKPEQVRWALSQSD